MFNHIDGYEKELVFLFDSFFYKKELFYFRVNTQFATS